MRNLFEISISNQANRLAEKPEISDEELNEDFIMPEAFDPRVADVVSEAVKKNI